jgi:hypothetical protein
VTFLVAVFDLVLVLAVFFVLAARVFGEADFLVFGDLAAFLDLAADLEGVLFGEDLVLAASGSAPAVPSGWAVARWGSNL